MKEVSAAVNGIVKLLVEHDYTKETRLDTLMSRAPRALAKDGNADAFEIAIRYCAYALEAGQRRRNDVHRA